MIRLPQVLRWAVQLAAAFAVGGAAAQSVPLPPSYAVISEVAREVSIVQFQTSVGSRLNNNPRQRVGVPEGTFDKAALLAAQQALKLARPGSGAWLIAPSDSDFFDALRMPPAGGVVQMPADLAAALKENRSTHLLVFTRFRADAQIRFVELTDSPGQLDGLGLYVDRAARVKNLDNRLVSPGFLAPYVHVRATLIDTATGKVLSTKTSQASRIFTAADSKDGSTHPWDSLSSAEKMLTLRDMLRDEVTRLVPLLLAES